MDKFSSEATKAGFQEPEKPVSERTEGADEEEETENGK